MTDYATMTLPELRRAYKENFELMCGYCAVGDTEKHRKHCEIERRIDSAYSKKDPHLKSFTHANMDVAHRASIGFNRKSGQRIEYRGRTHKRIEKGLYQDTNRFMVNYKGVYAGSFSSLEEAQTAKRKIEKEKGK